MINEILRALIDVAGQEIDGASAETELGKEWCKRINYSWQEGDTFEFEDALKEALTDIYEIGLSVMGADEHPKHPVDVSDVVSAAQNQLRASQRKAWAKACGVAEK